MSHRLTGLPLRRRTYLNSRVLPIGLLTLHLGIRLVFPDPTPIADLVIYNAVAFATALVVLQAPLFNSRISLVLVSVGSSLWAFGSTLSTWQSFYPSPGTEPFAPYINAAYTLFYPCMILSLATSTTLAKPLSLTQILDGLISSLGLSALIAASSMNRAALTFDGSAETLFFTLLFPAGDVVLLAVSLLHFLLLPKSRRSLLLMTGCALFAITDIYFLVASATTGYSFGSLFDDGWLLGLICISEAFWHKPRIGEVSESWSSISTTLTLVIATGILAIAALHPSTFVTPVIGLAIATIALAFLRMMAALRAAHAAEGDRALALQDELTKLPNRRRFITALAEFEERAEGSVLLLDLDGFKPINDQRGHAVGDQLLIHIAARFTRALPEGALLARLGGDEFGALIPGDADAGIEASEALLASISYPVHLATGSVDIGASIGLLAIDGKGESLKRCDDAMYAAKRGGGGITSWSSL